MDLFKVLIKYKERITQLKMRKIQIYITGRSLPRMPFGAKEGPEPVSTQLENQGGQKPIFMGGGGGARANHDSAEGRG
jgi:hypothetical protein